MNTPQRSSLKKRDITLNPLSKEWMRRKATPFGVRLLEGRKVRTRPNYTEKVFLDKSLSISINPFALLTRPLPIRKLIEISTTMNPASLPFARTSSGHEVMTAQLNAARKKEEALSKGIMI